MTEPKFRIYVQREKRIADVVGISLDGGYATYRSKNDKNSWHNAFIEDNNLMMSSGMEDKNGKEIFEGDIIKIPEDWDEYGMNAGELYEVYFAYGGFRMKPKRYKDCKGFWIEEDKVYEIVGNIYDNPELIGGEK